MLGLNKKDYHSGFTIVEMIVVISVIAILTVIGVVSYGSWRNSTITNKVKSDLGAVGAAMESGRNFTSGYPSTIPSTVTISSGVTITLFEQTVKTFCIDGSSSEISGVALYIDQESIHSGAQSGTCESRPVNTPPVAPTGLALVTNAGSAVTFSWGAVASTTTYTAQCASDAGFIIGLKAQTVTPPTVQAVVSGLTPSSTFYCRVKAVNSQGSSPWSDRLTTNTTNNYGSLAVASSVEGYWAVAPQGFLLEDGSAVSRTAYAALSLIHI